VKQPEKKDELIGTVFTLRLFGGITAVIFIALTLLISGEEFNTSILILIASAAFIFQSFSAIEYYFRAVVKAKYNAFALSASVIFSSALKVILILIEAPLTYFIAAFTFEYFVLAVGLVTVYKINKHKILNWKYSKLFSISLLKDSWPLALSGIFVMIYMKIGQVMIKNMLGEEDVGFYAAAVRLCEAWYFVPVTICNSIFPAIVNAKNVNEDFYSNRMQKLYDLLAWLAIGIAIPVTIFSSEIILIIFGPEFSPAAPVLTIYIWAGVAIFLAVASGQYLVNENLTKLLLLRTLIGMVLNVILNFILIPIYGIVGSAIATLVSYTAVTFSLSFHKKYYSQFKMMLRSIFGFSLISYLLKKRAS
ncbi:MAG: flippase, partial [Ignavibacteria bacterium]|nr:flippase [Ignavibacteria bacterium]